MGKNKYKYEFPKNLICVIFDNIELYEKITPEQEAEVISCLNDLPERERDVLYMRCNERLSCRAVGERFGLGAERIRQIQDKGLRRLRHPKYSKRFNPNCSEIPHKFPISE